ncbi:hypothetical protein C8034_v005638 [Colletotrichum sidae]|uniref:Aminoglycoside phosphotransferase domain-containing protein n=1 Tax=Colletotrichum sidae TaxID=1347389 RepID=A0A4R8TT65_9PEZI|nr:hypothetical protein C8034_v005638 [Colletotrichum sidae]
MDPLSKQKQSSSKNKSSNRTPPRSPPEMKRSRAGTDSDTHLLYAGHTPSSACFYDNRPLPPTPASHKERRTTSKPDADFPTRIFLQDDFEAEKRLVARFSKGFQSNRVQRKYVLWQKEPTMNHSWARWNPKNVPRPEDVHAMLGWYALNDIFPFPKVEAVELLGRGHTNIYFRVTFGAAATDAPLSIPHKVVFKFSLPVYPLLQLESEVATMTWARRVSNVVPGVLLFDPTAQNPLELEWLMMESVEGFVLQDVLWGPSCTCETGLRGFRPGSGPEHPGLKYSQQEKISKDIATLFRRMEDASQAISGAGELIGSLKIDWVNLEFNIDELVTDVFYVDGRRFEHSSAGPFSSLGEYLSMYTKMAFKEMSSDERVDLEEQIRQMLMDEQDDELIPLLLDLPDGDDNQTEGGPFTICPVNMSAGNILIDAEGQIVAILGWENAALVPTAWQQAIVKLHKIFNWYGLTQPSLQPLGHCLRQFWTEGKLEPTTRGWARECGNECEPPAEYPVKDQGWI